MRRTSCFSFGLAVVLALAGCESTGLRPFKDLDGDGGADGGVARSYRYTPEGCDYEVATPTVYEAGPDSDTVTDAPFVDHVHVAWAGPTWSTFAVNWRSDEDNRQSVVLYGTDEAAVKAADGADDGVPAQEGHHMLYADILDERTRIHESHVCGLEPSTTYYYKVGGRGAWSDVHAVSTGPELGSTEPVKVAFFGDSRNPKDNSWTGLVKAVSEAGADLSMFSGDAVFLGSQQSLWNDFFEQKQGSFVVQDALASMPMMMTNGNHDALSVNFVAQFVAPQNKTKDERANGEEWYSFDYANIHFVVLNDTVLDEAVLGGDEAKWLEADLKAVDRSKTPWIFVTHHRPFYTCQSNHRPDTSLRQSWQPIFDQYAVDLVFTGHNHVYERSVPIRGLAGGEGMAAAAGPNGVPVISSEGKPSGTVYLVSAGAGAELYGVSDECGLTAEAQSTHNYVLVDVDNLDIKVTTYNTDTGGVIDSFEYSKATE
ncbi:MAG: metallophosphoesterase family protein [Myxococcales bacterium]|nr:metallophosphoesterase family protein [Myxococcales bacterium]